MIPRNAVEAARIFLLPALSQAKCVVDATAGNGHDVLYFCKNTDPSCRIYAFDIQPAAIASSAGLLEVHGVRDRVDLIQADHARLSDYLTDAVDAAVFNLGYLPGRNHSVTTNPSSLKIAIDVLLGLLAPEGRIAIVAYPGHEPGLEEVDFLETYLAVCPQHSYTITRLSFINQKNNPAILYAIGNNRRNQHEDTPSVQSEGNRRKACNQDPG